MGEVGNEINSELIAKDERGSDDKEGSPIRKLSGKESDIEGSLLFCFPLLFFVVYDAGP